MNKSDLIIYNWNNIANISRKLAIEISKDGRPDLVVGITRGGSCIATIISEMLRRNMITVCATRRKNDIEITSTPTIISSIDPQYIKEKNILLIDEIVVTGKTINCVKNELEKLGAKAVKTCAIANRSNGEYICNYQSIITNKNNVIFPWDYYVLNDNNEIIVHPEYKDMCKDLGDDLDGI